MEELEKWFPLVSRSYGKSKIIENHDFNLWNVVNSSTSIFSYLLFLSSIFHTRNYVSSMESPQPPHWIDAKEQTLLETTRYSLARTNSVVTVSKTSYLIFTGLDILTHFKETCRTEKQRFFPNIQISSMRVSSWISPELLVGKPSLCELIS